MNRSCTLLVFCLVTYSGSMSVAATIEWAQPAFGTFNFGASWEGGQAPTALDVALLGSQTTTVNAEVGVLFTSSAETLGTWVASGAYDFRFGNPDLRYRSRRLVVGGSDFEFFTGSAIPVPSSLPNSASLSVRIPEFSSPGELIVGDLDVGSAPFANTTVRPGSVVLDGEGVVVRSVFDFFGDFNGAVRIGAIGNQGSVEVVNGASLFAEESLFVGGGSSRPFGDKPAIEVGTGSLTVSGRSQSGTPSTVFGDFLLVGTDDFDVEEFDGSSDQRVSVGQVDVQEGALLTAFTSIIGDTARGGLFANSRVPGDLPQDRITVAGGVGNSASQWSGFQVDFQLILGVESLLDLRGPAGTPGGFATVGNVAEEAIVSRETLYLGEEGELNGIGLIRGDVSLQGGTVDPGFSPGVLTIDGDLVGTDGVLRLEILATEDGLVFDQILVSGDVDFGGDVEIAFVGHTPVPGDDFLLIDAQGAFTLDDARITYSGLQPGAESLLRFSEGRLTSVPEPSAACLLIGGIIASRLKTAGQNKRNAAPARKP